MATGANLQQGRGIQVSNITPQVDLRNGEAEAWAGAERTFDRLYKAAKPNLTRKARAAGAEEGRALAAGEIERPKRLLSFGEVAAARETAMRDAYLASVATDVDDREREIRTQFGHDFEAYERTMVGVRGSWTDLPVVRRFVNPSFRGSQDKRDFYDRAGAKSSELRRALNGIEEYQKRGRPDAATAIFLDLDEPGKMFVTSQLGTNPTRRLHPLERARVFAQEASRVIGELNGTEPKDQGAPLPPMGRQTRQMVEDAIERITVAELRNAMVVARQPGFQNRELMDRAGYWDDLHDLAPEVAAELERRLGVGRDQAYDYDAVMTLWPQVQGRLKAEGSTAYLDDMAAGAEGRTRSWGEKLEIDGPEAMVFRP